MLIDGIKFSCGSCIKGHRQANCSHADRELFEVKKRGRPITACETCRLIRKENNSHKTCNHCVKSEILETDLVRSLPNGASDPASMALVRRASSVKSRSSASSANHPPLPSSASGANGSSQEEDLTTVGRKKSVSKSRRKDSNAAQRPHDTSHGHSAHHSTHLSPQFSPYSHAHAHPPNHAPLSLSTELPNPPAPYPFPTSSSPLQLTTNSQVPSPGSLAVPRPLASPRPVSTSDLASSYFSRGFEQLEVTSPASFLAPTRPDSTLSNHSSGEGAESTQSLTEPPRRASAGQDQSLPSPVIRAGRPAKERKRSGLAQMYGADEEADEESEGAEHQDERRLNGQHGDGERIKHEVPPLPPWPPSFNDYAHLPNVTENLNDYPAMNEPEPSPATFSLPNCDYSIPRSYIPPTAEYSSTAPSHSAYSGYTPPLERTTSYSVEEEEDPLGALADFQTQQNDLDILEWISTIAPLPPSSTPASTVEASLPHSSVSAFDFQPNDFIVSTPTSYPEPPPSVGLAPSDFGALALSPTNEHEPSLQSFPLPSDSSSVPPRSSSSSTSHSLSQSQSYEPSQGEEEDSYYLLELSRQRIIGEGGAGGGGAPSQQPSYPLASFNSGDIHLERYGIDESYFARLGSFEPTATPTSTPVHEALAGWEKRIEQTKGLMMQEFGQRMEQQERNVQAQVDEERQVREFATGSNQGSIRFEASGSNDSGSRERYQVSERSIDRSGAGGGDEDWWLKLNT